MDNTNNIDTSFNGTDNPPTPIQPPEPSIQADVQTPKKSPIKQTAVTTILIGLALFGYNIILLTQNSKSSQTFIYFIAGIMFIATGLVLLKNQRYGKKMFSIITWLSIMPIVILALAIMNPFGMLFLLAFALNISPNVLGQVGSIIGLNIYMHSANRTLSKNIKLNNEVGQELNMIKHGKLSYFGLIMICISIAAVLYSNFIPSIDPSHGKTKEYISYLEGKYNEKFELFDFKTTTSFETSFTTCDNLVAKAHPINNREITFEVSSFIRNCAGYDKYSDDYTGKFWEYEKKPEIEKKLKEVYGTIPRYEIKISYDSNIKFPKGPPTSINIIIANNYKLTLFLTTYVDYALAEDNVDVSEERTRAMSSFINGLGFTSFYFDYIMNDPKTPSADIYTGGRGVEQSDIHCQDQFSVDDKNYKNLSIYNNLKEYYSKICSYDVKEAKGGGVATGTYPR